MALFNSERMMRTYVSDLGGGLAFNNVPVKLQSNAPKLLDFYAERGGANCSTGAAFTPRRLRVVFGDGRELLYPVPRTNLIAKFVKELKPSVVGGVVPGVGANEAVCIDLLGERWRRVPLSVARPRLEDPLTIPLGRIEKETINFAYASDVLGNIRLSTTMEKSAGIVQNLLGDLDTVLDCQKRGLEDRRTGTVICASNEVKPRKFIISLVFNNNQNANGVSVSNRQVILSDSGIANALGNLLQRRQPRDVAPDIEDCAYCIGYEGESVLNVDQLFGQDAFDLADAIPDFF